MNTPVPVKRVMIVLAHPTGASHYLEVLRRLSTEGATNVVVMRTGAAIDASGNIEANRLVEIVVELPVMIIWVDRPENIDRILPHIEPLIERGFITIDETALVVSAGDQARDLPSSVTVGDVMTTAVVVVSPETALSEVVRILLTRGLRAVPVVNEAREPVGIITNGDLVRRGGLRLRLELLQALESTERETALDAIRSDGLQAMDVMTPSPLTTTADTTLRRASELMVLHGIKRLPVIDNASTVMGIVSRVDVLRAVAPADTLALANGGQGRTVFTGDTPARAIMSHAVPTVTPEMPIPDVLRVLTATRLNRAIVVDERRHVLGVVHDTDLLRRLTPEIRPGILAHLLDHLPFHRTDGERDEAYREASAKHAADLMQPDQLLADENTPIRDVLGAMLARNEKMVAVVNGREELIGVIDRADLLRGIMLGERHT